MEERGCHKQVKTYMKRALAILMMALLSLVVFGQENSFYKKVLSDQRLHSCYVLINRCDTECYMIENSVLFAFLNRNSSMSQSQYQKKMISVFHCDTTLDISSSVDIFKKIPEIQKVDSVARLGKDYFVHSFFQNNILKEDINYAETKRIIYYLFLWEIPCYVDCETGVLYCDCSQ